MQARIDTGNGGGNRAYSGPIAPERMAEAWMAVYADTCERITRQTVRAYGMAFTAWITGYPRLFHAAPGNARTHARLTEHYRRALIDDIEAEVDRQARMRIREGSWPQAMPVAGPSYDVLRQTARQAAHARAQALFLRGQYRINLLFFRVLVDLRRACQNAATQAVLLGTTAPRPPHPHDPAHGPS